MKDDAIRRRRAERDALANAGVRAFCLTNAQLTGAEQARRFVENRHRILRQAAHPGPYIYGVYEGSIQAALATAIGIALTVGIHWLNLLSELR